MDKNIFFARIEDRINSCRKKDTPCFFGFLTESEATVSKEILEKSGVKYEFFGGFPECSRTYLAVLPEWCENAEFPVCAITFEYRKQDRLSHRDFLGALMSLGIAREKIGDILVEDGRAVVFCEKDICGFIISQINKVGNVGVTLTEGFNMPLPELGKKELFCETVASTRMDCIVSALCNTSRSKALEIIGESFVCVNSFLCEKPTRQILSGDRISIRKHGKFNIVSVDDLSKKGRVILKYEKYI